MTDQPEHDVPLDPRIVEAGERIDNWLIAYAAGTAEPLDELVRDVTDIAYLFTAAMKRLLDIAVPLPESNPNTARDDALLTALALVENHAPDDSTPAATALLEDASPLQLVRTLGSAVSIGRALVNELARELCVDDDVVLAQVRDTFTPHLQGGTTSD